MPPSARTCIYASSSLRLWRPPAWSRAGGFREECDRVDAAGLRFTRQRSAPASYSASPTRNLYGIGSTGLRFFTVYGPRGRPDMAYFSFTNKMLKGDPIEVYGQGRMARDFTYIDDVIDAMTALVAHPEAAGQHRLLNVGDSQPRGLMEMITILERELGIEAKKIMRPMQPGDVTATYADVSQLAALTGYRPKISLEEGLARFVAWRRLWRA